MFWQDEDELFGKAYQESFKPETVKAAFRVTGVHPYNPNAIKDDQMKPSNPHSIKGSFPMAQPSPIRAIMAAMDANPPTAFDVSPRTHMAARRVRPTTPETPTRRCHPPTPRTPRNDHSNMVLDPNIDPALYTPTKRMRALYSQIHRFSTPSLKPRPHLSTSQIGHCLTD